jgi:hypothetical protein
METVEILQILAQGEDSQNQFKKILITQTLSPLKSLLSVTGKVAQFLLVSMTMEPLLA